MNLTDYAKRILESHTAAIEATRVSEQSTKKAIQLAIEAGKDLISVKGQLKYGQWLPWLAKNCKTISEDTAERYMNLANSAHVRKVADAPTLRQAYLAAGIIKQRRENPKPIEAYCPIRKKVTGLLKLLNEVSELGEGEFSNIAEVWESLTPLVEWYEEHKDEAKQQAKDNKKERQKKNEELAKEFERYFSPPKRGRRTTLKV